MPTGFPDYYGGLTLPVTVPEGGTGLTSITAHAVLFGNAGSPLTVLAPGAAGTALLSNGPSADPSWGNPTIDVSQITGILAIAHGGTGTASPGLVAGTGISITGTWPDNTITNSSAYAALADPLPVAHGGTGTASPALVAGSNISISGSWPDQTVALVASPSITTLDITPTSGFVAITLHHNETTAIGAYIEFHDDGHSAVRGFLGVAQGATDGITASAAGDVFLRADTGSLWLGHAANWALKVDASSIVTLANPLPIGSGGTGTASPGLVAGTGISITGTWPDNTITNSSAYAALADPLPVAHGGTGTASPALVAGSNISISGSWPDQTVALVASPSITTLDITPTSGFVAITLHHNETTVIGAYIEFHDDGHSAVRGFLGVAQGAASGITAAAAGDVFLRADTGSLWLAHSSNWALKVDASSIVTLANPLPIGSGGTGTASPALVAGTGISISGAWPNSTISNTLNAPNILSHGNYLNQTANLGPSTVVTPAAAGYYRITAQAQINQAGASGDLLTFTVSWTQNGHAMSLNAFSVTTTGIGFHPASGFVLLYSDASTAVQIATTYTQGGGSDTYDLHFVVEET